MKQLIILAAGFTVIIAVGAGLKRAGTAPDSPQNSVANSAPGPASLSSTSRAAEKTLADGSTSPANATNQPTRIPCSVPAVETEQGRAFREAIETLLSPQSTFAQKQAVWKKLKDAGQMADAVAELERRTAGDPNSVEDAVALGEAYLKQCGQTTDVREQAMLAMKADQVLDTALSLDPSNWEAQFYKVSAMAHWPLELNQGPSVLAQFQALIEQQESQPALPQFALSYVRLGDFYAKTGDANDAVQTWQRGAALFPDDTDLRNKLSTAP
jgi:hypothetical protein